MIKILYDYQAFDMQRYGGISRYFANLVRGIGATGGEFECKLGVLATQNHYLDGLVKPSVLGAVLSKLDNQRESLNKRYSKHCVRVNDFDVFHPTNYHTYFLECLRRPFVVTVHDMIHERYASYFQANDPTILRKGVLMRKAAKVIAISEATKRDILEFYPDIGEDRVRVVHHGHNPLVAARHVKRDLPERYVLFVGMRIFYKNFYALLDAFALLVRREKDLILLCAGGGEFSPIERDYLAMRNLSSNVRQISFEDDELHGIYRSARLFVYPSLYEGFGLPILEAFEAECPVLLSDTAPFREVAGDAALYYDPCVPLDMLEKMRWALDNPGHMSGLARRGSERLRSFTMESCVRKTLEVYSEL